MTDEKINIELTKEEAIVLYDYLVRYNESDSEALFEDQSEQRVLWDLESSLEKSIHEILSPDFKETLLKARNIVKDK